MKYILLLSSVLLIATLQAQDKPDPSVLKSEIKALEKVVNDEEKSILKLEKDLAKVRPVAEQAKRDAQNISDMYDRKKAELEAFNFPEKQAQYKALKKNSKKADKSYSKLVKQKEKLKTTTSEYESDKKTIEKSMAVKSEQIGETNNKIMAHSAEDQTTLLGGLKSKTPQDSLSRIQALELKRNIDKKNEEEKALQSMNKDLTKSTNSLSKSQQDLAMLESNERDLSAQKDSLAAATVALKAKLDSMDPKKLEKELSELKSKSSEAQIEFDKLNAEITQQEQVISDKHNILEEKKQAIREKESILDKL